MFTAGHDGFGVIDERTGSIVPWMSTVDGYASVFGGTGSIAYIGGDGRNRFTRVSGRSRNNLAAIDLRTGRLTGWVPKLGARYVAINAIVPSGQTVLVVCSCTDSIG